MKKLQASMNSANVIDALRKGPLREPAHAWLYEVRNSTGFARTQQRYADALVVSLWPSRGIWFAGIEVKVHRSDWLRELDKPDKSDEIQRFCNYWYVAAPEGVIFESEVPETWGFYAVEGKKAKLVRPAPKLTPEPLSPTFVASVLRNAGEAHARIRQEGHSAGYELAKEDFGESKVSELELKVRELEEKARRAEQQLAYKTNDYDSLVRNVGSFERIAGLSEGEVLHARAHGSENVGAQFKAARLLAHHPPGALADVFRKVAEALDAVRAMEKTG